MRRKAVVAFVGALASVMAFGAPAFGDENTETTVEAGTTASLNLTVEVDDPVEIGSASNEMSVEAIVIVHEGL